MSKYFTLDERIPLSKYLDDDLSEELKATVEYLMSSLGDVSISKDLLKAYKELFFLIGGKYDVRTDIDTVKGLYEFYKKFPKLSFEALQELVFKYIKDLFEDYELDSIFEKLITVYGETDDAVTLFFSYIETKADELDKKYKKEASRLDEYKDEYYMEKYNDFYQFIPHLQYKILTKHIKVDDIIDSLPSAELVKKDAQQLDELAIKHHCPMGMGYPISYLMTLDYATTKDLSSYGEHPSYYISTKDTLEEATFTTKEFIDSIKKEKKLIRKK